MITARFPAIVAKMVLTMKAYMGILMLFGQLFFSHDLFNVSKQYCNCIVPSDDAFHLDALDTIGKGMVLKHRMFNFAFSNCLKLKKLVNSEVIQNSLLA